MHLARLALVSLATLGCGNGGAGPTDAAVTDGAAPEAATDANVRPDLGLDGQADAVASRPVWCAAQWPLATSTTAGYPTERLFVRVGVEGITPSGGTDPALAVEVGFGPPDAPPLDAAWRWSATVYNPACLSCDAREEWMGTVTPAAAGTFLWAGRVRYGAGAWTYCDRADGGRAGSDDGWAAADAPALTVATSGLVRVVSLNLRCLLDSWDQRLPIIADALAAADLDLAGFEEVCAGLGRDNLAELTTELAARTGHGYDVVRTVTHRSWDTYDEGLAVLSRSAFASTAEAALPPGVFPRKVLMSRTVAVPGPLVFAVTHLDHESSTTRLAQAQAALLALADFGPPGEPVVLGGDFNEDPSGSAHPALTGAGYVDLWNALHAGEAGFTFPSSGPNVRIDYLWLRPGTAGPSPGTLIRILDAPVGGVWGSDHLGLSGSLSF